MAAVGEQIINVAAGHAPGNGVPGRANMATPKTFVKEYARLVVNDKRVCIAESFNSTIQQQEIQLLPEVAGEGNHEEGAGCCSASGQARPRIPARQLWHHHLPLAPASFQVRV